MTAELISVNCLLAVILSRTSRTGGARFPQLLVTAAVILSPHIPVALVSVSCHLVTAYHISSSIVTFSFLMSYIISYFVFFFLAACSHQLSVISSFSLVDLPCHVISYSSLTGSVFSLRHIHTWSSVICNLVILRWSSMSCHSILINNFFLSVIH